VIAEQAADHTLQTRASLGGELAELGIRSGDVILAHSSLRSIGWVCGGATAVAQALLDVIGPTGTLVVPACTAFNRDPSGWKDPGPPPSWKATIREHLPGFDRALSPSHGVGVIAERVRTWPGALRSGHPQTSFAALGQHAARIVEGHALESQLGDASPLARLEELNARVLLLGVGFDRCTAFHLGEYRVPSPPYRSNSCAAISPAGRRWVTYDAVALDASDFADLGRDFERQAGAVAIGRVGEATCRLFRLPAAVDFATKWFVSNRDRYTVSTSAAQ
jgi:aminoglycoside 3-N-acetyltransferase